MKLIAKPIKKDSESNKPRYRVVIKPKPIRRKTRGSRYVMK